jgi:hypothetical protein
MAVDSGFVCDKPPATATTARDMMRDALYVVLEIVSVPSIQTSYVRHYIHRRQGNCITKQNKDSGWSW